MLMWRMSAQGTRREQSLGSFAAPGCLITVCCLLSGCLSADCLSERCLNRCEPDYLRSRCCLFAVRVAVCLCMYPGDGLIEGVFNILGPGSGYSMKIVYRVRLYSF